MKNQHCAVIFDLDGVIVDSEPLQQRAFNQLLAGHGVNYYITDEEYGKYFVGVSVQENARWLIARTALSGTESQVRATHDIIYTQLIAEPKNLVAMQGLHELLVFLERKGFLRGVATGSPREHAEMVLRGLGVADGFRAVITGSDISRPKPDAEIYQRALAALQVEAGDAIALEDSRAGVQAAKAAGMYAIAVPNRYTAQQDLSHADARVNHLGQVIEMIEEGRV